MLRDAQARAIRPGSKALPIGGIEGLVLKPGSTRGRGRWMLRYVSPVTGKRRDMGFGPYPDIGIAEARRLGFTAREQIASGLDPIMERERERQAAAALATLPTFEVAARRVHGERSVGFRNPKHAAQWLTTLETYVFPMIGPRSVDTLAPSDFADCLRPIWLEKPETASRVRQRCHTVMEWCAAHGFVVASPVSVVDKLLPKQPEKRRRQKHFPAVPWRDLPAVMRDVVRSEPSTVGKRLLEFVVLTACRSGEARGMRWDEVDRKNAVWTVPEDRMKAGVAYRVPLSNAAIDIIDAQYALRSGSPYVFPSARHGPLSDMTLTKILRDHQVASGTPGRTATVHGFRSSFRDWASENGYARDLAERALAHTVKNATEAAYHRTDLLEQRRGMLREWANHCLQLCGGRGQADEFDADGERP